MKVDFDYQKPLDEILTEVLRMDEILEEQKVPLMKKIGAEVKKQVKDILPRSTSQNDGYSSGGGYEHMQDDIRIYVNNKYTGVTGVSVYGGRDTGYKWHMLDDGTRNPDGSVHTKATHFTSKAMKAAEPRIEQLLENLTSEVIK